MRLATYELESTTTVFHALEELLHHVFGALRPVQVLLEGLLVGYTANVAQPPGGQNAVLCPILYLNLPGDCLQPALGQVYVFRVLLVVELRDLLDEGRLLGTLLWLLWGGSGLLLPAQHGVSFFKAAATRSRTCFHVSSSL